MDYTIEYALMSELYDERSVATEGISDVFSKIGKFLKSVWEWIMRKIGEISKKLKMIKFKVENRSEINFIAEKRTVDELIFNMCGASSNIQKYIRDLARNSTSDPDATIQQIDYTVYVMYKNIAALEKKVGKSAVEYPDYDNYSNLRPRLILYSYRFKELYFAFEKNFEKVRLVCAYMDKQIKYTQSSSNPDHKELKLLQKKSVAIQKGIAAFEKMAEIMNRVVLVNKNPESLNK